MEYRNASRLELNLRINHEVVGEINAWLMEECRGMVMENITPIIAYSGARDLITMQKCV